MDCAEVVIQEAPVSERRRPANRRNAIKSTGPRTVAGKTNSRWNAVKHGLASDSLVIQTSAIQENPKVFAHLLRSLRDDLVPSGVLEEMLVERIAACYWRLNRCLLAESGAVVLATAGRTERTLNSLSESTERLNDFPIPGNRIHEYCKSSFRVQFILTALNDLHDDYKKTGNLSDTLLDRLIPIYGTEEGSFVVMIKVTEQISKQKQKEEPLADWVSKGRDFLLDLISAEIKRHESLEKRLKDDEMERLEADVARHTVPLNDHSDTLLRYETAIERQLYRAIDQLERLQCRRNSVNSAPPLRFDVNVNN